MRLNNECIRDLLLYLEENLDNENDIDLVNFTFKKYTNEDIIYTAQKLIEAHYINARSAYGSNTIYYFPVSSITYNGHQFLDTIRPQTVWEKTIEKSKVLGDTSISILSQIAVQVATAMITNQ